MKNFILAVLSLLSSTRAFSQIPIEKFKFYIDEGRKMIVCNEVPSQSEINASPSQIRFDTRTFSFASPVSSISTSEKYTVSENGTPFTLYFTEFPLVSLQVSNPGAINQEDEIPGSLSLTDQTNGDLHSNMAIRIRGNSSSFFPKKNYRVQFKDAAGKNKDETILGLRSDKRWLFFGMWNEEIRSNNVVSHKLWIDMHKLHYADMEPKAFSSIRMKYVEVFMNNSYLGLYAVGEDMDRKQLQLKKDDNGVMRGELYKADDWSLSSSFAGIGVPKASPGTDTWQHWEFEYPDQIVWDNHYNFLKAVIESNDTDFAANIGNLLKIDNVIDYYIFANMLLVEDNMEKNYFLARYDKNEPYFFVPWDLDGTWSYKPDGTRTNLTSGERTSELYKRLFKTNAGDFKNKLATRYFQLRQTILSESSLKERFNSNYNMLNGNRVFERDAAVSQDQYGGGNRSGGLNYILGFISARLVWLDNHFCPMLTNGNCNGEPPANCDFNVSASPSNASPACSANLTLNAACSGADCSGVTYQWSGNGVNQSGASASITAPNANGTYTYTVTASKNGCAPKTSTATITISGCTPPVNNDPFSLCLEAENQNGNGPVTDDPNASNGKTRGDKNNFDHYVDYAVNGVKATGAHQVKIRYYSNGAPKIRISVNGNVVVNSVTLPATNSWNIVWREETIEVSLTAGNNTLRIQGLSGFSTRQDKICVTGPGSQNPQEPTCNFAIAPSAGKSSYTPQEAISLSANCTGGDCSATTFKWSGNGLDATGASANVNAPGAPGTYTYTLTASKQGCADKTMTVSIQVAETPQQPTCDFNVSASPSNASPACSANVTLNAACSGADCSGVTYQWSGNGINQSGASASITAPNANGTYTYTVTASKNGCAPKTSTATITISGCTPPVNNDPFSLCLEAENQNGNGPVTDDPNASNGKTRGDKNNFDHYVDYAVNGVKATGAHQVKIRYYSNGAPKIRISVNGNVVVNSVTLPATNSWNIVWREETIEVSLTAGNNTLRIQGLSGFSTRQDKICVTGPGSQNPQEPTCNFAIAPSAGKSSYTPQEAISLSANCTGGDCSATTFKWSGNGLDATGASANVNAPGAPGTYTYTLTASKQGCADKTMTVSIQVAETPQQPTCDFNVSASPSNASPACSANVTLNAACSGADCSGVTYQWSGNGINQSGASASITAPNANGTYTYTVTASKNGCAPKTSTATITISGCTPPVNQPFSACLESENSSGNGPVTDDPNASNAKTRGDKNNYNHFVEYAVNDVPNAGTYQLKLRYSAGGNANVSISVNGAVILPSVGLPATYSWNIVFREETINVVLAAGNNTVRIQGLNGPSVRQDKICVSNTGAANARMGAPELTGETSPQATEVSVFPNPAPGEFQIRFHLSGPQGTIDIADVQGKIWYKTQVTGEGMHEKTIKLPTAPAGIYLIRIQSGQRVEYKKLLTVK